MNSTFPLPTQPQTHPQLQPPHHLLQGRPDGDASVLSVSEELEGDDTTSLGDDDATEEAVVDWNIRTHTPPAPSFFLSFPSAHYTSV